MKKLRWSDIWILVSAYIALKKECFFIKDIIGIADTINHAIANYEELSSAMVRLEEHGYIKVKKNPWQIVCTDICTNLVEPVAMKNSLGYRIWKQVEIELNVPSWVPGEPLPHPENNLVYSGFSEEEYKNEINAYLSSINK